MKTESQFIDNDKTSSKISYDKELGFYHRGEGDLFILREQKLWNELTKLELKGQTILDLGAHIGAFQWYMSRYTNAAKSIAVEPDPNNLRVLRHNKGVGCTIIPKAVLHNGPKVIELYLHNRYPAANSIESFKGRRSIEVEVVEWTELLKSNPTAIKCDIEGSEYLLDWSLLPSSVKCVVLEVHFHREKWKQSLAVLNSQLVGLGFTVVKQPKVNTFRKVSIGVYRRK